MISTHCNCEATEHGPWMCNLWTDRMLSTSDPSICNFIELQPESQCKTHTNLWRHVSTLFSECCRNENSKFSNLQLVKAIWVGNGQAALAMENYRKKLLAQKVDDVSSKYLFHVSKTIEDTISIYKTGFRIPELHECNEKCGRHIIGMGIYAGQPKYVANLTSDLGRGQRVHDEILTPRNPLKMLMCEVIPGNSYPAYACIHGSSLINGYNSHKSVGQPPHETVIFEPYAIRPIYIIEVIKA